MKDEHQDDQAELLQLVLDSIPSRVFWKDSDLRFLGGNQLFAKDAGCNDVSEMVGKNDYDFPWAEYADQYRADDLEVMQSGVAKLGIEEAQPQSDGSTSWLLTNKVPMRNDEGAIVGILGTYSDITEKRKSQREYEFQALYDSLTQLPNRFNSLQTLQSFVESERDQYAGLLFVDLDHFKIVNDTRGHIVGDKLLQAVAERITESVPKATQVARLGGDEFCVLLTELSDHERTAKGYLQKACRNINRAIRTPFDIEDNLVYLGSSIGISFISAERRDHLNILREADLAMYDVKVKSRNNYTFYDDRMHVATQREHSLQNRIRRALENDEFRMVYQPQVSSTGDLLGIEALIRCDTPDLGKLHPIDFIPLAEETGLIHALGDWAINAALKDFSHWRELGLNRHFPRLSINISAKQFQHVDLVEKLRAAASWHRIPHSSITLEITETTFFNYEEQGLDKLHQLRDLGFEITLDDFGTGFSSLNYLARMPVTTLKIDRSFVIKMLDHARFGTIVKTTIALAKSLDMDVIAEGVEQAVEKEWLLEQGCDTFQGYLFSKPLEANEFEERYVTAQSK